MEQARILLISLLRSEGELHTRQLLCLFDGKVDVLHLTHQQFLNTDCDMAFAPHLVVMPTQRIHHQLISRIPSRYVPHTLIIHRAANKTLMDALDALPEGTVADHYFQYPEAGYQILACLRQLGSDHLRFNPVPADERQPSAPRAPVLLTYGDNVNHTHDYHTLIDLSNNLLDVSTIIDIGSKLKMEDILNQKDLLNDCGKMLTTSYGLQMMIRRYNRFEGQVNILHQVTNEGIVALDNRHHIYSINESAEKIFNCKARDVLGARIDKLFDPIDFSGTFQRGVLKEELLVIRKQDVIVTQRPVRHTGREYGAIITLRRFNDVEQQQHNFRVKLIGKGHRARYTFEHIQGSSPAIAQCKAIAQRMANSESSILINGESGTGKELFSQAIHNSSPRQKYQFVAINCGALPENLLESELFGYEEGAFTGARKGGKPGLFELAHKGTLFLDEIGEMSPNLQMRLLRVLQEREVMRVGGDRLIKIDIRLIAATNKELMHLVKQGKFREDLYYRVNVLPLRLPPLRDRKEDIIPMLNKMMERHHISKTFTPEALTRLAQYNWPGNVRQLQNYVEYFSNLDAAVIDHHMLPLYHETELSISHSPTPPPVPHAPLPDTHNTQPADDFESFRRDVGNRLADYHFLLVELKKAIQSGQRIGRRTLSRHAAENGLFITEQEVRNMLLRLEAGGFISIRKGRGGSVPVLKGQLLLEYIEKRLR